LKLARSFRSTIVDAVIRAGDDHVSLASTGDFHLAITPHVCGVELHTRWLSFHENYDREVSRLRAQICPWVPTAFLDDIICSATWVLSFLCTLPARMPLHCDNASEMSPFSISIIPHWYPFLHIQINFNLFSLIYSSYFFFWFLELKKDKN